MDNNALLKRALFIDRDGTLVKEPPVDFQLDSLEKLEFVPGVLHNMRFIASTLDYELVIVSNQDGLGTDSFPEETFLPAHNKMLETFAGEGVIFDDIIIDKTFPEENAPTRKPGTALLTRYTSGEYDLRHSFVIGDRITDIILARNLGAKGILLTPDKNIGNKQIKDNSLEDSCALVADSWDKISDYLRGGERTASIRRHTSETDISIDIDLDGEGIANINTGLGFFDHMLTQIARHSGFNITINVNGDLYVDEHHTIEDTGIALGEAILSALGDKRGIERYGFVLPMDDCLCTVALDFGGRPWLQWSATFKREKIGDMPTEMFHHFFKSISDSARINLAIIADGENEHHKIEGIFKSFAKALKAASKRDVFKYTLPSTKGTL